MKKITSKNIRKDRKFVTILGLNLLSTDKSELLTGLEDRIAHNKKFRIFTPNPEFVLASTVDQNLKKAAEKADFLIPDGVGLNYASLFLYGRPLNIIPGRKLFTDLVSVASKKHLKIFLLGGEGAEAELASDILRKKYKRLKIQSFQGPELNQKGEVDSQVNKRLQRDTVDRINKFSPDLLFVAFGVPKQELWVDKNFSGLKTRGIMTVGGTFRYVAGLSKLPPEWMEELGLEWLYRVITEPYRMVRIIRATILFPVKIIASKFNR